MPDKADKLVELARREFPNLLPFTAAEEKMLRAAVKGETAVCGPVINQAGLELLNANLTEENKGSPIRQAKANLWRKWRLDGPRGAVKWDKDRTIRAKIIRWLCTDAEAQKLVDLEGVQVEAARIEEKIDLGFATVPFPLALFSCAVPDGIDLMGAETRSLYFNRSHIGPTSEGNEDNVVLIHADGLTVRSVLSLHSAVVRGEVRLPGAKITGDMVCIGGQFENENGYALNADSAEIGGAVFLNENFRAIGEVRLLGAKITGVLVCCGGRFENEVGEEPKALSADRAEIGGDVFLNEGFHATGEVRLPSAKITGDMVCIGGQFENENGDALSADGVEIGGSVFLNKGFHATGEVRLSGAKIRGQLSCRGGWFENENGDALIADEVEIGGGVFLNKGFRTTGEVRLLGAKITGDLSCRGGRFENENGDALSTERAKIGGRLFLDGGFRITGQLNLIDARVGVLLDSEDKKYWPEAGNLRIGGFEYGAITSGSPTDAKTRKEWLERQYPKDAKRENNLFRPQPYEQLAKVLRLAGHKGESRKILLAGEDARRKYSRMNWLRRFVHWLFKWSVGYGYRLWLALIWLAVFVGIGTTIYWDGPARGLIEPAKERVYLDKDYKETGQLPKEYPKFCAPIYSLDCFIPLVDLHQEDYWHPSPHCRWKWPLWGYLWFHIIAGWLLTYAVVAGITKAVRRRED
ncbi:MAG: hypothetical protein KAV00_16120 [Phycisphaerae bacterium]|nr:hypothetical protein [Phycisphaerae bacterium]